MTLYHNFSVCLKCGETLFKILKLRRLKKADYLKELADTRSVDLEED